MCWGLHGNAYYERCILGCDAEILIKRYIKPTCWHIPEVPPHKLQAVASQKYCQTNYMLSRSRSKVKQITCCQIPEVYSNELHVVTPQKYSHTNYMLSNPRNTVKQTTRITFRKSVIFTYIFGLTWNTVRYIFRSCFLLWHFENRILHPSRSYFPCSCLQLTRPSKLFHTKSVGVLVMYLHEIGHV
jgi:hypothetical protein